MVLILGLAALAAFDGAELFPLTAPTEDDATLQEDVERLLSRPIDLNRAGPLDLLAIPWIDAFVAYAIVRRRDSLGRFDALEQLRLVPGMTDEQYQSLAPFVRVGERPERYEFSAVSRSRSDSLAGGARQAGQFTRATIRNGPWRASGLVEKDQGEPDWFDFIGGGLEFRSGRVNVVLGDYTCGAGRGLVLAAAGRRGTSRLGDEAWAKGRLGLRSSAAEGTGQRGLGAEARLGRVLVAGGVSAAARDARLTDDGTVERLRTGGVHDDSASQAERGVLTEYSGSAAAITQWTGIQLGVSGQHVRYSRSFSPSDSADAFHGNSLSVAGANAEWVTGGYVVGTELAYSSGGGAAAALELSGNWPGVSAGVNLRGHGRQYFAPHGRWSSMMSSRERLDASARFGYQAGGFSLSLRGNTYRDFQLDSLPARLVVVLGQQVAWLKTELELARSLKASEERYRTGRLKLELEPVTNASVVLVLADEQPELRPGRGLLAAVSVRARRGLFSGGCSAARFAISGPGITMSVSEPGAMRVGSSYSTSRSAWRAGAGLGFGLARHGRLGLKAGCTWAGTPVLDAAAQLELEAGDD